ncbi:MAG: MotA/TolQ/ExbB proton channel family protein [Gemmatimonadetes bacterium]|nr:MAG: MotA/TolQ/ExbB proton channel family protein [Gemmatimonadota bacterium]
MLELIESGGLLIYPLMLCSILALAVIIERMIALRKPHILPREIVQLIQNYSDDQDAQLIVRVCKQNDGVLARVVRAAVDNRYLSREELKEIILDTGRRETRTLEKHLVVLETVAAVAPLLGLLGTVTGMIRTFTAIAEYGVGQANYLSEGISEALITTAVGLAIGIPALIAYNYFIHRAENMILDIEELSALLMYKLKRPVDAPPMGENEES